MKSNNQGVKEETFIQTGRRGRGRKPGGENSDKAAASGLGGGGQGGRSRLVDQLVPHLHGTGWDEQLGSKTDYTTQGSSVGK